MKLSICGLTEFGEFWDEGITHIVSIWGEYDKTSGGVEQRMTTEFPSAILCMAFFDDVTDRDADCPPTEAAVCRILKFTRGLPPAAHLLIHCAAGVSRSTAIGFAVLCQHRICADEIAAYARLMELRPYARPNSLIIELADAVLGRSGMMIQAAGNQRSEV